VIVSGGKQYRVASGDRILVDRLAAEPGSRLTLDRVLMIADGDEVKLGAEALAGQVVTVKVLDHRRGPKIDVLRYRPKKRVRVHRGARADLTALEILSIGAPPAEDEAPEVEKPKTGRTRLRRARPSAPARAEEMPAETASEATETDPEAAVPEAPDEVDAEREAAEPADEEKE
jgi:large subunit ribosomal protein L21